MFKVFPCLFLTDNTVLFWLKVLNDALLSGYIMIYLFIHLLNRASLVAQTVKNLPSMQDTRV